MATSTSVCAVCDHQHQTTQSTHWCIECEEPLCADCKNHHTVLKATKTHKTISISDYQLLPSVVTDIKQHCIYHNEIYQLYCNKHEHPICNKCVKDHGKCGDILNLDDVVRDITTSESFVDLEQSLDDLFTNINKICKDRESNIESITCQKQKITAQVFLLKKQVIQHVEKLGEEFIKELDQIESDCCDPIRSIVSSLQDKAKEINKLKSEIKNTKKYASNLQTFLNMREIQAKSTENEKHLHSCIENEDHESINIEIKIDTKMQDILNVDRFGSIYVKKGPLPIINLQKRKDRQAQIMVPKPIKLINEIKLDITEKIDTTCKYPVGCCVTRKGAFFVTNYEKNNNKVLSINAKGEVICAFPHNELFNSYDVVCLDDSLVAISTGHSKKSGISIFDLLKRKVIRFITLPGPTYGITYDGKSLLCCVSNKDLHVISSTDYRITTIFNTAVTQYSYVSTHDDKIFFTNTDKHNVSCCFYNGSLVWEFKDESILNSPRGITIDNNGNVFVAGHDSCNVVVISFDGKECKQILTKEDGLDKPTAICFDKERNQLLVTNEKRFAYVNNISYL